jgi:hypothetical protein
MAMTAIPQIVEFGIVGSIGGSEGRCQIPQHGEDVAAMGLPASTGPAIHAK